jgi:hypothetical protein
MRDRQREINMHYDDRVEFDNRLDRRVLDNQRDANGWIQSGRWIEISPFNLSTHFIICVY